jgi:hypothetical protein
MRLRQLKLNLVREEMLMSLLFMSPASCMGWQQMVTVHTALPVQADAECPGSKKHTQHTSK